MQSGTCRLCTTRRDLCKSHIIPEYFYGPLYDDAHFMEAVSADPDKKPFRKPKGEYERLLCRDCETRIKESEDYFLGRVFRSDELRASSTQAGRLVRLQNLDYRRVKLLQMSILWRASVSTRPFFAEVKLGVKHDETLRTRILNDDPGPRHEYSCMTMLLLDEDGKPFDQLVMNPTLKIHEGRRFYRFVFGAFAWAFLVSSPDHPPPENWLKTVMGEDGNLTLFRTEYRSVQTITDLFRRIADAQSDWLGS